MAIDYFVLGIPFMKGYYTTFDYDNMQVGYVPFSGSTKAAPVKASSTPTDELASDSDFFLGLSLT